jgi:hypothetical protein
MQAHFALGHGQPGAVQHYNELLTAAGLQYIIDTNCTHYVQCLLRADVTQITAFLIGIIQLVLTAT